MIYKNTIKNLTNHKYIDEDLFYTFYNIKNEIFNEYTYILKKICYNIFCRFKYDHNENIHLVNNFEKDILSFFTIKKEICFKEKKIRKQKKILKIFIDRYKICHDIQGIIISFLI